MRKKSTILYKNSVQSYYRHFQLKLYVLYHQWQYKNARTNSLQAMYVYTYIYSIHLPLIEDF